MEISGDKVSSLLDIQAKSVAIFYSYVLPISVVTFYVWFVTHSTPCNERISVIPIWEWESWYLSFLSDMPEVILEVCGVLGYTNTSK